MTRGSASASPESAIEDGSASGDLRRAERSAQGQRDRGRARRSGGRRTPLKREARRTQVGGAGEGGSSLSGASPSRRAANGDTERSGTPIEWDIAFKVDGKPVAGNFRVRQGQTNAFQVPIGKISYFAAGNEDSFDLAANENLVITCYGTDAGTMCMPPPSKFAAATPTPNGKTAKVEVKYEYGNGSPIELTFVVGGNKVAGKFSAPEGKTTTFTIPAGRMRWHAWGDPKDRYSCESGNGDPSKDVDLAEGETALLDCWNSAKSGNCCQEKKKVAPVRRSRR